MKALAKLQHATPVWTLGVLLEKGGVGVNTNIKVHQNLLIKHYKHNHRKFVTSFEQNPPKPCHPFFNPPRRFTISSLNPFGKGRYTVKSSFDKSYQKTNLAMDPWQDPKLGTKAKSFGKTYLVTKAKSLFSYLPFVLVMSLDLLKAVTNNISSTMGLGWCLAPPLPAILSTRIGWPFGKATDRKNSQCSLLTRAAMC